MRGNSDRWEEIILEELDEAAGIFDIPMPDHPYFGYGMMTLTVFRSHDEWLLAFDEVRYDNNIARYVNAVYAFGNRLEVGGRQESISTLEPVTGEYFDNADGSFSLDPLDFSIRVRGKVQHVRLTETDYDNAGVVPTMKMRDSARVLRYLVWKMPEALRLTPEQLLDACERDKTDLAIFMHLEEWCHPNLTVEEVPSEKQSFRSLARAVAQNNPALYSTEAANTHWTNWLEA